MPQPSPQPQRGGWDHRSCAIIPYGGLLETIRGGCNSNLGVSADFSRRDLHPRSVRNTETLLPAHIRVGAQTFPDRYKEGRGGFLDLISYGVTTPPWNTPGNTRFPVQVNDATPLEVEAKAAFHYLPPFKAGGHNHLRADHSKQWIQEAYTGENSKTPLQTKQWVCLVDIV